MKEFYLFGSPIVGLIVLIAIVWKLLKRGKRTRSYLPFTIAFALTISGVAAVGFVIYMWVNIFRAGSWAGIVLIVVPLYGLYVLLGVFPLAWAMTILASGVMSKRFGLQDLGDDYGSLSKFFSVLMVLGYVGVGASAWRRQWQHDLVYDETASQRNVLSVYGHGAWRKSSPGHLVALAQRSHSPAELLAQLATHDDPNVRHAVANNPNTPIHSLEALANDPEQSVRMGILTNRSSTPPILRSVAATKFTQFPAILFVNNPNTPEDVLAKLASEDILASHSIQRALAEHPNLPRQLAGLLLTVNDEMTRRNLAANPSCPVEILVPLSSDQDPVIVAAVANNSSTPTQIAEMARRKVDAMNRMPIRRRK